MLPKRTGPYKFVKYKGRLRAVAVVRGNHGRLYEFSAGHLIPLISANPGRAADVRAAPMVGGSDPHRRGGELLTPRPESYNSTLKDSRGNKRLRAAHTPAATRPSGITQLPSETDDSMSPENEDTNMGTLHDVIREVD